MRININTLRVMTQFAIEVPDYIGRRWRKTAVDIGRGIADEAANGAVALTIVADLTDLFVEYFIVPDDDGQLYIADDRGKVVAKAKSDAQLIKFVMRAADEFYGEIGDLERYNRRWTGNW